MIRLENFGISTVEQVWIDEKKKRELTELPENFYDRSASFVAELRRELRESDGLREEILEREFEHVLSLVQEVYLIRILKITSNLFEVDEENYLEEEKEAFSQVEEELSDLREGLIEPVMEGEFELRPPEETSNILVRMNESVEEPIVASDMNHYGPFEVGDLANLPKRSAELMVGNGLASKVSVKNADF